MILKLERRVINLDNFKEILIEGEGEVIIVYKENKDGEQIYSIIDIEDFDCWCDLVYKTEKEERYDHKDLRWIRNNVAGQIVDIIAYGLESKADILKLGEGAVSTMIEHAIEDYKRWLNDD